MSGTHRRRRCLEEPSRRDVFLLRSRLLSLPRFLRPSVTGLFNIFYLSWRRSPLFPYWCRVSPHESVRTADYKENQYAVLRLRPRRTRRMRSALPGRSGGSYRDPSRAMRQRVRSVKADRVSSESAPEVQGVGHFSKALVPPCEICRARFQTVLRAAAPTSRDTTAATTCSSPVRCPTSVRSHNERGCMRQSSACQTDDQSPGVSHHSYQREAEIWGRTVAVVRIEGDYTCVVVGSWSSS